MKIADLPDTHPLKKALIETTALLAAVGTEEGARISAALLQATRALGKNGPMEHGTEDELIALASCVRSLDEVRRLATYAVLPQALSLTGK